MSSSNDSPNSRLSRPCSITVFMAYPPPEHLSPQTGGLAAREPPVKVVQYHVVSDVYGGVVEDGAVYAHEHHVAGLRRFKRAEVAEARKREAVRVEVFALLPPLVVTREFRQHEAALEQIVVPEQSVAVAFVVRAGRPVTEAAPDKRRNAAIRAPGIRRADRAAADRPRISQGADTLPSLGG